MELNFPLFAELAGINPGKANASLDAQYKEPHWLRLP